MDSAFNLVYAMRGVSSLKTYEQFIDLKWWGYSTPKEFPGTAPRSLPDNVSLSARSAQR
jgi:hypothetical protein